MLIPCVLRYGYTGSEHPAGKLRVNESVIGLESTYCGSYHILVMDQHFRHYVASTSQIAFPACANLPSAHPYVALSHKVRATGVFGNIGETVTGIVARRILGASAREVVHIKPKAKHKSPDYMIRIGPHPRAQLLRFWPSTVSSTIPEWWPVEAKARPSVAAVQLAIRKEAFVQLGAYWHATHAAYPDHVGYGIAVGFAYEAASIQVVVFTPSDRVRLLRHLQRKSHTDYVTALEEQTDTVTERCLRGC